MSQSHATQTIGRIAQQAGVNVETIRYYQRIGLLREPAKPVHGYRRYSPDVIARLCFIKRAQELGFTLKEIADLLSLDDGNCGEVRAMAEQKRDMIEQRIRDLRSMHGVLDDMVQACRKSEAENSGCALIETLNDSH
ncbi:MAG TPA: MerR family transcriptional regulator [Gammaproteobacteria bacterium]|nr:MerR family transcriptional regulator [Gammaproteobacteria bacterium]